MRNKAFILLILIYIFNNSYGQFYGPSIISPEIIGNSATFILKAPKAKQVKIYGDFLPGVNEYGLGGNAEMTKNKDGIWEYTTDNLSSEFYFYYYDLDGVKITDPLNFMTIRNYSEYLSSFIIKGEESKYYEVAKEKKGSMSQGWYYSSVFEAERRMNVYLPYGYSSDKKYPALYLQHGGGDDEETWGAMGRVSQIMDNLIAEGKAEPMIVIIPNTLDNQLASQNVMNVIGAPTIFTIDHNDERFRQGGKYVDDFIQCIIPYAESHYSIKPGRENKAISGLSMGGIYSLYTIEKYPEMFSYIGIMGMGYEENTDADIALKPIKNEGYKLFWIGCGKSDIAYGNAVRLMDGLKRNKMDYTYFDSRDGHNWRSWRRDLVALAQLLFK